MLLTGLLDACVHAMMHWAARRRRRVDGGRAGPPCCSEEGAAHDMCASPGIASPASSECGEEHPIALRHHSCAEQPKQLCSSCAAIDAAYAKEAAASTSEGSQRESEMEMGSLSFAGKEPAATPPRISVRRQPCCAGNPDCCGPTARCYNTGLGPAAAEIEPGTEAAEVVAVLQSDPHTQDLLRMGESRGAAGCKWAGGTHEQLALHVLRCASQHHSRCSMHSMAAAAAAALARWAAARPACPGCR